MSKHKKTSGKSLKSPVQRWRRWLLITAVAIASVVGLNYILNDWVFQPVANPNYGTSFSIKQAKEYGSDWRANYTALLDDLKIKRYRLMSYWDLVEPARGQFDFADLDWQMDEAAKRGAKVSLAVGLRQPRWPECHQPVWVNPLVGHEWRQALYSYMEQVVKRYQHHPALASWQLENEALNNWFGKCGPLDSERLVQEFNLLKQWDPGHPVIMSLSDEHGLPVNAPIPDIFGYSMYQVVYNTNFGPPGYVLYPAPVWWHRLRSTVITLMHNKPQMVHELQMEPWGPTENYKMTIQEQNKSMSPEQIGRMADFARRSGFDQLDMWGSEWWYWRKVSGDSSIWEAVRQTINKP